MSYILYPHTIFPVASCYVVYVLSIHAFFVGQVSLLTVIYVRVLAAIATKQCSLLVKQTIFFSIL